MKIQRQSENPSHSLAPAAFSVAEVIAKGDEYYVLKHEQGSIRAKAASSFLFVAEIHDQVLVLINADQAYIVQILERVGDIPLTLRSHDALILQTPQLQCQAEVLSLRGQALHLDHNYVEAHSEHVHLHWQQTVIEGEACHADLERVRLTTKVCDYVVDTLTVKAKHVLEWIDELKQQMLGRLHVSVQKKYQLDCESVDIYSQQDVKIDANQVHLG
jgi:hypothetical protein